jgi:1-deoxy-D-xylulose-5-phosphate reductoisomerase
MAGKIPFTGIVDTVAQVVSEHDAPVAAGTLDEVLAVDAWARARARELNSEGETAR